MGANGLNHETHEIHEREIQNHEWTRMGTNIIISWNGATALQIIPERWCFVCFVCFVVFKRTLVIRWSGSV